MDGTSKIWRRARAWAFAFGEIAGSRGCGGGVDGGGGGRRVHVSVVSAYCSWSTNKQADACLSEATLT